MITEHWIKIWWNALEVLHKEKCICWRAWDVIESAGKSQEVDFPAKIISAMLNVPQVKIEPTCNEEYCLGPLIWGLEVINHTVSWGKPMMCVLSH